MNTSNIIGIWGIWGYRDIHGKTRQYMGICGHEWRAIGIRMDAARILRILQEILVTKWKRG